MALCLFHLFFHRWIVFFAAHVYEFKIFSLHDKVDADVEHGHGAPAGYCDRQVIHGCVSPRQTHLPVTQC